MNISITFRHMDSSDAIKTYAEGKLSKLQKFLRRPMTAKVTLSIDRLKHAAEARISSGGEHLEAHERSEDMYASIDRMMDKLERQIRGSKGAARARRRDGDSLKTLKAVPVAREPSRAKQAPGARKSAGASGTKKKKSR
jgi:putative sigma-54 modulation protein